MYVFDHLFNLMYNPRASFSHPFLQIWHFLHSFYIVSLFGLRNQSGWLVLITKAEVANWNKPSKNIIIIIIYMPQKTGKSSVTKTTVFKSAKQSFPFEYSKCRLTSTATAWLDSCRNHAADCRSVPRPGAALTWRLCRAGTGRVN